MILPPRHSGGEYGHISGSFHRQVISIYSSTPLFVVPNRRLLLPKRWTNSSLRTAACQHVPLPDPRVQATQLLPKMTAHDDIEVYLQMFENTITMEGWDRDDWARALAPLLTGEAQRTFFSLPTALVERYDDVKREILARVGLSPVCAAQCFQEWVYQPRRPARAQAAKLSRLAQHWLMDGATTAAQVTERVVSSRYAESHDHAGVSGCDRAGWGASAAFPSEGGPGATRAGGNLATNRQDGGPQSTG